MAFTQTRTRRTVVGNLRLEIYVGTFTGVTSGTFVTGLGTIEGLSFVADTVRADTTFDHTSTAGSVAVGGVTSGDIMTLTVMGRS